jgi:hypothetical protein
VAGGRVARGGPPPPPHSIWIRNKGRFRVKIGKISRELFRKRSCDFLENRREFLL